MTHRLATLKTFSVLATLLCASAAHSQDSRFEFVDKDDTVMLQVTFQDISHQIDLSEQLRTPSYVLDEFTFSDDEKTYAILSVGFPSRGEYTATGMCASGSEEFIVYLTFEKGLTEVSRQVFPGASCLRGLYPDILNDGDPVSSLGDLNPAFKEIKISFETEDEQWQYLLTRKDLSAFVRDPED